MATIELQTSTELAESRRKMQAKRRMKNRIALALSMATMAFGLFWLIWILMATITRGFDGMSLALFTYDAATGAFATVAGKLTVPEATFTQNADGSWTVTPGQSILTVTGTV